MDVSCPVAPTPSWLPGSPLQLCGVFQSGLYVHVCSQTCACVALHSLLLPTGCLVSFQHTRGSQCTCVLFFIRKALRRRHALGLTRRPGEGSASRRSTTERRASIRTSQVWKASPVVFALFAVPRAASALHLCCWGVVVVVIAVATACCSSAGACTTTTTTWKRDNF